VGAHPFAQYDWPVPAQPTPAQQHVNQSLILGTVPFTQPDWPLPTTQPPRLLQDAAGFTIIAEIQPFRQRDWPNPTTERPRVVLDFQKALRPTAPGPKPFAQYDWPLPTVTPWRPQPWPSQEFAAYVPLPPPPAEYYLITTFEPTEVYGAGALSAEAYAVSSMRSVLECGIASGNNPPSAPGAITTRPIETTGKMP
jgi:hypothetical protein